MEKHTKSLNVLIDKALDKVEATDDSAMAFAERLLANNPAILAYLFSEDFDMLTDEEADYSFFLSSILLEALQQWKGLPDNISPEQLGEAEESFWERLETARKEKAADLFDVALPEDLDDALAGFILEALDAEVDFLTAPGRELVFVKLATLVSVIQQSSG